MKTFSSSNPPTIQAIKELGYEIRVLHMRPVVEPRISKLLPLLPERTREKFLDDSLATISSIRDHGMQEGIYPYGGLTAIQARRDGMVYVGSAHCSSKDLYCRKTGLQKALWRLAFKLELLSNKE